MLAGSLAHPLRLPGRALPGSEKYPEKVEKKSESSGTEIIPGPIRPSPLDWKKWMKFS
jgi:hypothetical protein